VGFSGPPSSQRAVARPLPSIVATGSSELSEAGVSLCAGAHWACGPGAIRVVAGAPRMSQLMIAAPRAPIAVFQLPPP
jgi:hypothetical protein